MSKRGKRVLAVCGSCALVGVGAPLALATGDGEDHIKPAKTPITASLKPCSASTFTASTGPATITISCKKSSTSTITPARGLGPTNLTNPTFKSCTDSLGGTDTSTTSSKNGHWTIKFIDAANDESKEKPGDKLKITVPKAGAKVTSTSLPGCTIVVAPNGPAAVSATYNDAGTAKFNNAPVPYAGSGDCTFNSGTAKFSGTYLVKPIIHDAS